MIIKLFKKLDTLKLKIKNRNQEIVRVGSEVARRCSVKKVFLEILQNSQENTYARVSFLIKLITVEPLIVATLGDPA